MAWSEWKNINTINNVTYKGGTSIICKVGDYIVISAQTTGENVKLNVTGGKIISSIGGYGELWIASAIVKATSTTVTVNNAYANTRCVMGVIS